MTADESDVITAILGAYDEFEGEIVIEILREAGIRAFPKVSPTENATSQYPGMHEGGEILVEESRQDEARRLIAEQLPVHLASIKEAMETLQEGMPPEETDGD